MANPSLRAEMKRLLDEDAGDKRTNAATTLDVAFQSASKHVAALKAASKAYANALSQLPTALKAAHELSHTELKSLKKLLDRTEETTEKLKKYILYADANAAEAGKLAQALKAGREQSKLGPEPDPDKPFH